jgi:hypothetical protein
VPSQIKVGQEIKEVKIKTEGPKIAPNEAKPNHIIPHVVSVAVNRRKIRNSGVVYQNVEFS